jgi:hypothetical protein
VDDKDKGKNIIVGSPRLSKTSQGMITQKAPDKRANKIGGVGGWKDHDARDGGELGFSKILTKD